MTSISALYLKRQLLSGTYSAGTFETALAAASTQADWAELVGDYGSMLVLTSNATAVPVILGSSTAWTYFKRSTAAMDVAAESDYFTKILCQNGTNITDIVNDKDLLAFWRNNTANYTRLKNQVNAASSKLKRQVFTSGGTWTKPTTLLFFSYFLSAGGGGGATGVAAGGSGGGGGGEAKVGTVSVGSVTTNQTITIGAGGAAGSAGSNSSIGALVTAAGGGSGTGTTTGSTGGGTTTGNGYLDWNDTDVQNAVSQPTTSVQKGGNGGGGATSAGYGTSGSAGYIANSGGAGGQGGTGINGFGGTAGTYAGGGGGGGRGTTGTTTASAASNNTAAGGGGGGNNAGAGSNGFTGGSGLCVIYWVEG